MSFKKLKIFMAGSMLLIIILVATIILLALSTKVIFMFLFPILILGALFLVVSSLKLYITNTEKIFIGALVLLIVISSAFFANGLKDYADKTQELGTIQTQIKDLATQEAYALSYSEYFTNSIKQSEDNALVLAQKISNLKLAEQPVYVVPEQPIILNYRDYEENDD